MWLSLAGLLISASFLTWWYLGSVSVQGQPPSLIGVIGWLFWMSVLAITFIWLCWVKTDEGWRWRWQNF